ncbi:MAG: FAD-binding protein, partial [Burkholderiales bacterium]|nr:FAD-binding protein [Burkholderiales bacterium]
MAEEKVYDVIVIGAGPGGYVAANCAAHQGLRVCS